MLASPKLARCLPLSLLVPLCHSKKAMLERCSDERVSLTGSSKRDPARLRLFGVMLESWLLRSDTIHYAQHVVLRASTTAPAPACYLMQMLKHHPEAGY
mmetsp:Transcript_55114/g.129020  ORF Transcript_55114/g.129020 Transcript_55114/m.129020 type:complete len:99 (-) Transcript_55114:16-312(-)